MLMIFSKYAREFKTIKLKVKSMNKQIELYGFTKTEERLFNIYLKKLTDIYSATKSNEVKKYLDYLQDLINSYTLDYKIEGMD